jgi:hypothetical protein
MIANVKRLFVFIGSMANAKREIIVSTYTCIRRTKSLHASTSSKRDSVRRATNASTDILMQLLSGELRIVLSMREAFANSTSWSAGLITIIKGYARTT